MTIPTVLGWACLALSLFVLVLVYPGRYGSVALPRLLPVFGIAFALIFIVLQYALVISIKSIRGIALVSVTVGLGMLLGWGRGCRYLAEGGEPAIPVPQFILVYGACVSSIAVGLAIGKRWVAESDHWLRPADWFQRQREARGRSTTEDARKGEKDDGQ